MTKPMTADEMRQLATAALKKKYGKDLNKHMKEISAKGHKKSLIAIKEYWRKVKAGEIERKVYRKGVSPVAK